ncbi:hydrogenase formation protein HypD [Desulfurispira natronophila]|uniref:Hydrogenase expression/formation protein HypD n=1 Tax=Desulfurispira natronophila TaxID=682562 RepID=A0A7W7Y373_9BACT|nr:hydrogenase formation protein HypD [Desulfurispira natronophila]MBB5020967.1 hydrogenase expression/formation protein HypD [Desulfurispira natronophila]
MSIQQLKEHLRHPSVISSLADDINKLGRTIDQPLRIMEICGGHTHAIVKNGLDTLVTQVVRFVHGPGCPVCVLPQSRIDQALYLARENGTILVCLGDMMRVPGSEGETLQHCRAQGADVRFVYSPLETLDIARKNPGSSVVFFAIGFETTTPTTAALVQHTIDAKIPNIKFHINHVLVPPAIDALLHGNRQRPDAFIAPGHVSVITGWKPYELLSQKHHVPIAVAGFEPIDILEAIRELLICHIKKIDITLNSYHRVVSYKGNHRAQELVDRYFDIRSHFNWRGLGSIPASALQFREEYSHLDAETSIPHIPAQDTHPTCQCGAILMGQSHPWECPLFGNACTPAHPVGSCMVSNEGACAAYYRYRGVSL